MKARIYRYQQPHPFIKQFIEIKADANEPVLRHYVPPLGYPEIILYLGNRGQIKNTSVLDGFIKGQYTNLQTIDFQADYHFLSIALYPYGLKQLLGLCASDFVNAVLDINEHPLTAPIAALVKMADNVNMDLLNQIEKILRQGFFSNASAETIYFINLIENSDEHKIQDLLAGKGISIRTLQRKFKNEVGLSPKEFLRIKRMNKMEEQMSAGFEPMQLVADFDFSDQSHLIKEFKQFRNFTPKELCNKKLLLTDQLPPPELVNLDS